jgi:hypothetical protein
MARGRTHARAAPAHPVGAAILTVADMAGASSLRSLVARRTQRDWSVSPVRSPPMSAE